VRSTRDPNKKTQKNFQIDVARVFKLKKCNSFSLIYHVSLKIYLDSFVCPALLLQRVIKKKKKIEFKTLSLVLFLFIFYFLNDM
jgi:hypothetical protein